MSSCFLNTETNFIWAFIAPVIVIILINVGFFIMAAIAMWRHNKRQSRSEMSKERFRSWLKTLSSLVVVMGLTWIFGVLIVEVEELVPLAFIFTSMVAFQGVWIFFIFVVFPQKVRDAYVKLWRTMTKTSGKQSNEFSEKNTSSKEMVSLIKNALIIHSLIQSAVIHYWNIPVCIHYGKVITNTIHIVFVPLENSFQK